MRKYIISHFYNEEYLLYWWLNHHKDLFDYGIMINYQSTDSSVDIIKNMCPHWVVVDSKNTSFEAALVDNEVMDYEKQITGWRIVLNTTEFIVGNIDSEIKSSVTNNILIPSISFFDWNPTGSLDKNKKLWEQKTFGRNYKQNFELRKARSLHNISNVKYGIGRHYSQYNCEKLLIYHFGNCISSKEMLSSRLQIQHKIPVSDKINRLGFQHYGHNGTILTQNMLYENYLQNKKFIHDQSEYINLVQ